MSIDRGDRVIQMMFRSLCGCGNRAKVSDSAEQEILTKQRIKNVLIICTQNILTRGLVGKLLTILEDRRLSVTNMKLLRPEEQSVQKSSLVRLERRRDLDEAWLIMICRGWDGPSRVQEVVQNFRNQFSLSRRDIYFTDSVNSSEAEERIWFSEDGQSAEKPAGEQKAEEDVENPPQAIPTIQEEEEVDEEVNPQRSSTDEVKENEEEEVMENPEEHKPTNEIINDTVDILKPNTDTPPVQI